jgi:hypothetical protein
MAKNNCIFISFAIEDERYRDFLVGQARNEKSPFVLVDMSVKQPCDNAWKTNCRTKIKGGDGVIALARKKVLLAVRKVVGYQVFEGKAIRGRKPTRPSRRAGQR